MSKLAIYNIDGEKVGELELLKEVFDVEIKEYAVHQVVVAQLANKRQGTQSAKTRAEVSGGGKKPWRQKGTGRARQGSIRSPQWIHGGVVFAPKPRDYRMNISKTLRKVAIKSVLTSKVREDNMLVLNDISFDAPKTKNMVKAKNGNIINGKTVLIIICEFSSSLPLLSSNICLSIVIGADILLSSSTSILLILSAIEVLTLFTIEFIWA